MWDFIPDATLGLTGSGLWGGKNSPFVGLPWLSSRHLSFRFFITCMAPPGQAGVQDKRQAGSTHYYRGLNEGLGYDLGVHQTLTLIRQRV